MTILYFLRSLAGRKYAAGGLLTVVLAVAACTPALPPKPAPGPAEQTTGTLTPAQEETPAVALEDIEGTPEEEDPEEGPGELPEAFPEPEGQEPPLIIGPQNAKIGLLLPLSGKAAEVGQALMNAAQLALFDHATENFELIVRDTGGQAPLARRAAEELIAEGAKVVIGPLFGQSVTAVAPIARQAGLSVLAFSNDRAIAGHDVYLLGLTPEQQIDRVVSYARRQGIRRFALLAPENRFGQRIASAMSWSVQGSGGQLVRKAFYRPGEEDQRDTIKALANYDRRHAAFKAQRKALETEDTAAARRMLARLKGRDTLEPPGFEAILVAASGLDLLTLAPLLNFYDVDPRDVRYLGTAQWDNPRLGREPTLTESWFTSYSPENWGAFAARYRRVYGAEAPRLSALAYDAVAMAAIMARAAENQARPVSFDSALLTRSAGFAGINGYFRLGTNGQVERALPILTLERDAVTILEKAPDSLPLSSEKLPLE